MSEVLTLPTTEGLRWFGQAIRGSWADIDGRSIQGCMESYAAWMDENPAVLPAETVREAAHERLAVCLAESEWGDPGVLYGSWSSLLWGGQTCVVCGRTGN